MRNRGGTTWRRRRVQRPSGARTGDPRDRTCASSRRPGYRPTPSTPSSLASCARTSDRRPTTSVSAGRVEGCGGNVGVAPSITLFTSPATRSRKVTTTSQTSVGGPSRRRTGLGRRWDPPNETFSAYVCCVLSDRSCLVPLKRLRPIRSYEFREGLVCGWECVGVVLSTSVLVESNSILIYISRVWENLHKNPQETIFHRTSGLIKWVRNLCSIFKRHDPSQYFRSNRLSVSPQDWHGDVGDVSKEPRRTETSSMSRKLST